MNRTFGRGLSLPGPGRVPAVLLALALGTLAAGCAIFPKGAYWPACRTHLVDAAVAEKARADRDDAAASAGGAAARQAVLQDALTRRWADEDLVRSARQMDGGAGRWVYADALQVLVWCYVDSISYRQLVAAGMESLRAALDNARFRERFPEAADDAKRAPFAEALDVLRLKIRAADPWFAFQAADWLAVAMEKNRAMLGLPDGAVVAEFLFGAMDSLDPYTHFMTGEMLRRETERFHGEYPGIGAEIQGRDGRFFVRHVLEGGAAAKAGLKPGDEIAAVEGQSLEGQTLAQLSRRLRGKAGTPVKISVRTGGEGEPREVTLIRTVIYVPAVRDARILDAGRGIGYLRLTMFKADSQRELRRAVDDLARRGAKALILDLRDNPGGSLLEAVGVVGVFLPRGRVLETRGRMLGATWTYDVPFWAPAAWRGPLAVLTNEHAASASEVVAAALSRHGRATVVGRRTYGKGAVQINVPVGGGATAVCVTIARVYDPKGEALEGRGVAPQREVAEPATPTGALRDDPAVRAAVEALGAAPAAP